MQTDPVSVIESAYRLDSDEAEWVRIVAEAVRPRLDFGLGLTAWTFRASGADVQIRTWFSDAPPGAENVVRHLQARGPSEGNVVMYGAPWCCTCASQMFDTPQLAHVWSYFQQHTRGFGVADVVGLRAIDPSGFGITVCGPSTTRQSVPDAEERRWRPLCAHLAAGLRLRLALSGGAEEAVMNPDGRLLHAEGPARGTTARERLRDAARCVDRARGPLRRRDAEEAVALWRALVAGRWSIVDRFDSDGRRFVVARYNEPRAAQPAGLSQRERQVVVFAALGYANKLIAYALGLSPSTVETHLRNAQRKLGAPSRIALIGLVGELVSRSAEPTAS